MLGVHRDKPRFWEMEAAEQGILDKSQLQRVQGQPEIHEILSQKRGGERGVREESCSSLEASISNPISQSSGCQTQRGWGGYLFIRNTAVASQKLGTAFHFFTSWIFIFQCMVFTHFLMVPQLGLYETSENLRQTQRPVTSLHISSCTALFQDHSVRFQPEDSQKSYQII